MVSDQSDRHLPAAAAKLPAPDREMALLTSATFENAARLLLGVGDEPIRPHMVQTLVSAGAVISDIERALCEGRDDDALRLLRELLPWSGFAVDA